MFITGDERALIKRGMADGGRKVINYVPNNFHQRRRLLDRRDRHRHLRLHRLADGSARLYSFGTGNDYSTKVARAAERLIVEVNENMPRVHGDGAELHVSEVDAIVENNVPLLELPVRGACYPRTG